MTPDSPQSESDSRSLGVLQTLSASAIAGVIFAVPAFLIVFSLRPDLVGFYLIATAGLITHISLLSIDANREKPDIDVSELSQRERIVYALLMFIAAVVGVTVRLGAATVLAMILTDVATIGIIVAALYPVFERQMADVVPQVTPSVFITLAVMYLLVGGLNMISLIGGTSAETITKNTRRLGPI